MATYAQQLKKVYKPQKQALRAQWRADQPLFAAQEQGLKQAKINAFRDISNNANASGMLFSGFTPAEEARYTGEQYLPALANVKQARIQSRLDLRKALLGLDAERRGRLLDYRTGKAEKAEDRAYQERMDERNYQRQLALSGSSGGGYGGSDSPSKFDITTSLQDDINQMMVKIGNNPARKDNFYTERQIKNLISAYPELDPNDIANRVYSTRKLTWNF